MFRLSLLSLFFVAANADLFGTADLERQLQQNFDLDAFQFNFAGININAAIAQELCPESWQAVVGCVVADCPQFMEVCPELEVPAEFEGTVPPTTLAPAVTMAPADTDVSMGDDMKNMTDGMMNITDDTAMGHNDTTMAPMTPDVTEETDGGLKPEDVPTCDEIETEFCAAFVQEDVADCCLVDCADALQALISCLVMETTGVDRSNCGIPECPTPAPTPATGDSTGPTDSATGVASKLAIVSAAAFAFAML